MRKNQIEGVIVDDIYDTTLVGCFLRMWEFLSPSERETEMMIASQYKAKNDDEAEGLSVFIETLREAENRSIPEGA